MTITIRELSQDELPLIWPLISNANAQMTRELFEERLAEMVGLGYRCLAAFEKDALVGCCGFWYGVQFWCGKYMELDNVRIHPDHRGKSIGPMMLEEIERIAKEKGCELAWLKSYTHNAQGHKFFHRNDYWIQGFIFRKNF